MCLTGALNAPLTIVLAAFQVMKFFLVVGSNNIAHHIDLEIQLKFHDPS